MKSLYSKNFRIRLQSHDFFFVIYVGGEGLYNFCEFFDRFFQNLTFL